MTQNDRVLGIVGNAAIKIPVRTASTGNLTLSGEQTINGVACVTGDRILVKDQTDATENGIWDVDTGSWERAQDFDGSYDAVTGTIVMCLSGTVNSNTYWRVTTSDPIVIGTSSLAFAAALASDAALLSFLQAGTGAVTRTAQSKMRDIVSVKDFDVLGDGTDETAGIQAAVTSLVATGGAVFFPTSLGEIYNITSEVSVSSKYPIHLVSNMSGFAQLTPFGSFIKVGANIAGSIFKYSSPTANRGDGGGGAVRGLAFRDTTNPDASTPGTKTLTAALHLYDFGLSSVENCSFHYINGSAIKTDRCIQSSLSGLVIRYCGETLKPALWISATDASNATQATKVSNVNMEVCHDAPYLQVDAFCDSNQFTGLVFEADTAVAATNQNFVKNSGDRNSFSGNFNRNTAVQVAFMSGGDNNTLMGSFAGTANGTAGITVASDYNTISVNCASAKTGDEITVSGVANTINGVLQRSGGVTLTGSRNTVTAKCYLLTTTNAYWIDLNGTRNGAIGCTLDGDLSGSSGGIRLQSVTTPYAIGNTVRNMAGIGVRNESSNGRVIANTAELCTGGDFSTNTALGIHESNSWFDRQPANTPKLRYSTVPLGAVAYAALGTDTATVAGTIYWAEVWVDKLKSITGVGTLNGATVGADKVITALYDSDGTLVANSALAGTNTAGPNVFQDVAFTAAYIATPGRYWIAIQRNGTTDTFRSIAASTYADVLTKSVTGAFGTLTTLAAPSTFTATVGPIAYVY